jgi:hypothetical protein
MPKPIVMGCVMPWKATVIDAPIAEEVLPQLAELYAAKA